MKFLLDHDVPEDVARVLAQAGHEVHKVSDVLHSAALDPEVFNYSIENNLLLVTCNRDDFLDLTKDKSHYPGVVILIRRRRRIVECAALIRLLDRAGSAGIEGNINFA